MRVKAKWHLPLGAALACLTGPACSASTRPVEPIDCSAGDAYELSAPLRVFEIPDDIWFNGGDTTGATTPAPAGPVDPACATGGSGTGGTSATSAGTGGNPAVTGTGFRSVTIEPIEDGGRCGSANAMVLRSSGHNDWGSLFGDWKLASAPGTMFCDVCGPWNGSGYEGIAIWARSATTADKAVTLLLDTWQTSAAGAASADPALVCDIDCNAGSGTQSRDEAGNITSQTYVSPPGTCGNSFRRTLMVTPTWQLHVLPFSSFFQERKPNMSPSGLDPAHINGLTIRAGKEAVIEMWIDDIAFYRRK